MVRLEQIADLAKQFVLVQLDKITGLDLNLFDFDYDLTWMGFFLNADEKIYGRFGGRDAKSAETRLSLPALRHALQAALEAHQSNPEKPAARGQPLLAEQYPAAKKQRKGECIHCHQIYEFRRADLKASGKWSKDEVWIYPLPENLGLDLEIDQGNKVKAVRADSPAAKAGLRAGDLLKSLNGQPVASFADIQYGLHRAPAAGKAAIAWQRDGKSSNAELELVAGWRKTNPTWRPSLLDLFPSLTVYGEELSPAEKKALGLAEQRLAFRQQKDIHAEAQKAGVQPGDVIVGLDGLALEMDRAGFFAHVRRNFLVGDRITLDVIRNGKPVGLPLVLK